MSIRARFASSWLVIFTLFIFFLGMTLPAFGKDDWQSDLHNWAASNDTNPRCKVRYTTGIYRPDMGSQPAWGMMTENMFKWLSKDGVKLAPSVCTISRNTKDKAAYRILLSVSPMKTVSQTTHGSEVQTTTEPFNASINSQAIYSDGGTANSTATINGQQTTTLVVPTETTFSRSSVAVYMYTYRVDEGKLELIASDSVVFSRVAASGSGDNAAGAELGAGIGNLIRASGDRHRPDKLYEEALKAIQADALNSGTLQAALPGGHASEGVPPHAPGAASALAQVPVPAAPSATLIPTQASLNIESTPSGADIEIDGAFVGDTPSILSVAPGSHQIVVNKKGFTDWRRALNVTGGSVHLNAELEERPAATVPVPSLPVQSSTSSASVPTAQSIDTPREQIAVEDAETQFHRGTLYEFGRGVEQDYKQALLWYRKAAQQNFAVAQYRLGVMYANGLGVPLDKAESAAWFQRAANQGYADAQEMLGSDYLTGEGVKKDYAEAYFWLDIACVGKAREFVAGETATMRDTAAIYLTPADKSRVQLRVRKWFEDHPAKAQ